MLAHANIWEPSPDFSLQINYSVIPSAETIKYLGVHIHYSWKQNGTNGTTILAKSGKLIDH